MAHARYASDVGLSLTCDIQVWSAEPSKRQETDRLPHIRSTISLGDI